MGEVFFESVLLETEKGNIVTTLNASVNTTVKFERFFW